MSMGRERHLIAVVATLSLHRDDISLYPAYFVQWDIATMSLKLVYWHNPCEFNAALISVAETLNAVLCFRSEYLAVHLSTHSGIDKSVSYATLLFNNCINKQKWCVMF